MHKILWIILIFLGYNNIKDILNDIRMGHRWTEIHRTGVNDFFPYWFDFLWSLALLIMAIFGLIFL
jgi:hypothetical protein